MARPLGFSTGSLAPGDISRALSLLQGHHTTALELSSLRTAELPDLLTNLTSTALDSFTYISVHAPSRFIGFSEAEVLMQLAPIFGLGWPIILHPDAIQDWDLWAERDRQICIENMDSRKAFGKTIDDLTYVFDNLPEACFCFDIGHAWQIDPTMELARTMLIRFGSRLRQIHLSAVNQQGGHEALSPTSISAFQEVVAHIPAETPIILETPVYPHQLTEQIRMARLLFP